MICNQILIQEEGENHISEYIKYATNTVKSVFNDHKIWNNKELETFIQDIYGENIANCFKKLNAFAHKSNLGRLCLINHFGGWYCDIGLKWMTPINVPDTVELITWREILRYVGTTYTVNNSIIYSKPNNPVIQTAIDFIVENCREEYYGMNPLCVSGCTVLGRAIANYKANPNHVIGDAMELTPHHQNKNKHWVLPDGTLLAANKPAGGGDLKSLGVKGNNYNDLYKEKKIYDTSIKIQ